MAPPFRIIVTAGLARSLRKLTRKHPEIVEVYQAALEALQADPTNLTRTHDIKKLTGVRAGDGQWRIRVRQYRLRYDINGVTVTLQSINDRKDAYR